eukprot:jgi/Ulvmu1/5422/UM022_0217.1
MRERCFCTDSTWGFLVIMYLRVGILQGLDEAFGEGVLPNTKHFATSTEVHGFDTRDPVVHLSAGYSMWLALTKSSRVYTCATGFDGYAGTLRKSVLHGGLAGAYTDVSDDPEGLMPQLLPNLRAQSIAAGRHGAGLVSTAGDVYTWGTSPPGRSGVPGIPAQVIALKAHRNRNLCMGEHHAVALSQEGQIFVWGSVRPDQDVIYDGVDLHTSAAPLHAMPQYYMAMESNCGYQHTVILAAPKLLNREGSLDLESTNAGAQIGDSPDMVPVENLDMNNQLKDINAVAAQGCTQVAHDTPTDIASSEEEQKNLLAVNHNFATSRNSRDPHALIQLEELHRNVPTMKLGALPTPTTADGANEDEPHTPVAHSTPSLPGIRVAITWVAEDCGQGQTRPSWIKTCTSMPESVHILDRAWYGMYQRPNMDIIQKSAEEVFEDVLFPWIPNARSPCWLDMWGTPKFLPLLSIIGVSKRGTTDLYQKLMRLRPFTHSYQKGLHFWDDRHSWNEQTDLYQPIAGKIAATPEALSRMSW